MRATFFLIAAFVASTAAAGLTSFVPGSAKSLPTPRMSDRSVLKRLPEATDEEKPPFAPFPTNAWWSGGSLEDWPAPLYAWPLVVELSPEAVTVDARKTVVNGNTVHSAENAPLRVRFDAPADRATVSSFGDWDVTFDLRRGGSRIGRVTAVQGSPYAWMESDERTLHVDMPAGATTETIRLEGGDARLVTVGDASYLVASTGTVREREGRLTVSFPMTGTRVLSVATIAPDAQLDPYLRHALSVPRGTRVSWKDARGNIETTFSYPRVGLVGLLPHHVDTLKYRLPGAIGTYQTLRGPITLIEVKSFTTRVFAPKIERDLPLRPSLAKDKAFLETLRSEIGSQNPAAGDSYAAGKQLLRSALLALLADGTGDAELKKQAIDAAANGIGDWCGGKYGYDARLGGVIGQPTSFGSEHYNDHHFHYGYVIHAAGIVAELDKGFERRHGDCIDALVRDIAAGRGDPSFPFLRYMDAYAGHSWANGLTRFADGQNQESVSEAVQAWHSVAVWGDVTGDTDLSSRGRWLLSQELLGAKTYWFNAGATKTLPAEFPRPMVSILWGGKADFATFFDASEGAIHGIQFFPAVPAIKGLFNGVVARTLAVPLANEQGDALWTNHLRLVAALAGQRAPKPGTQLDAFYSASYVRNLLTTR